MSDGPTEFPLSWPTGWPRVAAADRRNSAFKKRTVLQAADGVRRQLELMEVPDCLISSDLAGLRERASDPGVAVYFELDGAPRVLACDTWARIECNLRAIELHVEALRGIERWGVGTIAQAFQGYAALPAQAGGGGWWDVLGVEPSASAEEVLRAYKRRAQECHPDAGGDHDRMAQLNAARDAALEEKG